MKHLLAIADLDRADLQRLLDAAELLREKRPKRALEGATVVNLFLEASTRTRVSFEIAAKRLGADVVNVTGIASSVTKGESLADTGYTLDAMAPDVIVIRHSFAGSAEYLAAHVRASVVNAGDGQHEHPTQALLDALTIRRALGSLDRKVIAIVGDIRHSRVARSGILAFSRLGASVRVAGPATLMPAGIEKLGATVMRSADDAVRGADVVMTLRIQNERMLEAFVPSAQEYSAEWRIDARRMSLAKPNAIVMHPGPMNRGVEITAEVADSSASMIRTQVANGVLVRMAVLQELVSARKTSRSAAEPRRARKAGGR